MREGKRTAHGIWIPFLYLILLLMCSPIAIAQMYIGDGAIQIPGTAGGTVPGWSPTTGGWDISWAIGGQCLACHNPSGGGVGAHDKSSYVMTGHKNVLRKVSPGNPWAGADGLPYSIIDQTPDYIYGSGSTYDWTAGTISVGAGPADAFGPGVNVIPGNQDSNGNYLYYNTIRPLYYIFGGWSDKTQTDAIFKNGFTGEQYPNGTYDCARCHTTGYRFDDNGPEPKDYLGSHIPAANFSRVPTDFDPADPSSPNGSWQIDGVQCERCHNPIRGDHYTLPQNQGVTLICLQCHREETADIVGNGTTAGHITIDNGASYIFAGGGYCSDQASLTPQDCATAGGTWATPWFDHESGPTFLNSPHARFSGSLAQNAQNSPDLTVVANGAYNSAFSPNPSDTLQNNGCSACHDVHQSLTQGTATPLRKTCTDCHADHAQTMTHPIGPNTPFPNGYGDPGSCVTCHMVQSYHLLRISTDGNYSTFPTPTELYAGTTTPHMAPETTASGTFNAVWLDVDLACGQCHVGGNGVTNPYGITPIVSTAPAMTKSAMAAYSVNIHLLQAATPTFSPGYPYTGPTTTVSIASATSAANIYYTTDGSTPTTSLLACANPCTVPVNSSETILAIAATPGNRPSQVAGGLYTIQAVPKPTITPYSGTYNVGQTVTVTLSDSSGGATIVYTTDGSDPKSSGTAQTYGGALSITTPTIVKAFATQASYADSGVTTGTFNFKLAAPAFSNYLAKYPGTYYGSAVVRLTNTNTSATICYRIDNVVPTAAVPGTCDAPALPLTYDPALVAADPTHNPISGWPTFTLSGAGYKYVKAIATAPPSTPGGANYINSIATSGTYVIR